MKFTDIALAFKDEFEQPYRGCGEYGFLTNHSVKAMFKNEYCMQMLQQDYVFCKSCT